MSWDGADILTTIYTKHPSFVFIHVFVILKTLGVQVSSINSFPFKSEELTGFRCPIGTIGARDIPIAAKIDRKDSRAGRFYLIPKNCYVRVGTYQAYYSTPSDHLISSLNRQVRYSRFQRQLRSARLSQDTTSDRLEIGLNKKNQGFLQEGGGDLIQSWSMQQAIDAPA